MAAFCGCKNGVKTDILEERIDMDLFSAYLYPPLTEQILYDP
jgi:hypothetical protein